MDQFYKVVPLNSGGQRQAQRSVGNPLLEPVPGLHQLTKAPFEPIKEASLRHLTVKTVFLLALGSGKLSVIHAWQNRNIGHQSDWSKLSLYPSPSFPRISWPNRVQTVWPQWLNQPWPQIWIGPSSLTGHSIRSKHCATIWTGPQAEQGVGLCPL